METQEALAERVTELEIKLSFQEDQMDALNRTAYEQHCLLEVLQRELIALRQQVASNQPGATLSLRDELPPHY